MSSISAAAIPSHLPDDAPAVRFARLHVDDLGVTVVSCLRLAGAPAVVRDALGELDAGRLLETLETALSVGLLAHASALDARASHGAHQRLITAAEKVEAGLADLHAEQTRAREHIAAGLTSITTTLEDRLARAVTTDRDLRERLLASVDQIAATAKTIDGTRADFEDGARRATLSLLDAQNGARDAVLQSVRDAVRDLADPTNPASAPHIVRTVVDRASTELKALTEANLTQLDQELRRLLGADSPFARSISQAAREETRRELSTIAERLDALRTETLVADTRLAHDPLVKGDAYEDRVCALLSPAASAYGLTVVPTGREIGAEAGSKKGDVVLEDEHACPRIAVEVRARRGVSARGIYAELSATAANRSVNAVAYVVPSADYLPNGFAATTRGGMPCSYKRLPGDVHALVAVLDPKDPLVAERAAVLLWLLDRMGTTPVASANAADAEARIADALSRVERLTSDLGQFRQIKSSLTTAGTAITKARTQTDTLEAQLITDLDALKTSLNTDR